MEILVTMVLLSIIVLGLLMMFNQTQRAFRSGLAQTDVLEGGRIAMDLIARDLEQMAPCEETDLGATNMYNFWTALDAANYPNLQYIAPGVAPGDPPIQRANAIQQFFFLSKLNQDWIANYYRVEPDTAGSKVGSLWRYTWTNWPREFPLTVGYDLLNYGTSSQLPPSFSRSRILDGVIHLHLTVFDTNGVPLIYNNYYNNTPPRNLAVVLDPLRPSVTNAAAKPWPLANNYQPDQTDYQFWNNAIPAYVELELGILESKALQHYRAIDPATPAAQTYLSNAVGQVHIFRQRIPIRNVDFSAYQ